MGNTGTDQHGNGGGYSSAGSYNDEPNRAVLREFERLSRLLGKWTGQGRGRFPTIEAFDYAEDIEFVDNGSEPLIHYEQRTWDITHQRERVEPLHWETGFIRPCEDGWVEIWNAQNGGRVEVLRGRPPSADAPPESAFLELDSTVLGNDDRMVRTRRTYFLVGDTLKYELHMATRNTPQLQIHLRGELRRMT